MSTADVANDLVALCRVGKNLEAIEKYYDKDTVSLESAGSPEAPAELRGIEAIKNKNRFWFENHEVHSAEANGPYIGKDQFAVQFNFDFTHKPSGRRMQMTEMALYTLKDGKIVHEHFYYNPGTTPADWL